MNKTVYHNDVPPHFIFQKYKNIDPLFKTVLILKVKTSENCEPEWSFFSAGLFEMISPHSNEMQASQPNSTPRLTHSVQEKVSRKRVSFVSNLMTSVLFFLFSIGRESSFEMARFDFDVYKSWIWGYIYIRCDEVPPCWSGLFYFSH